MSILEVAMTTTLTNNNELGLDGLNVDDTVVALSVAHAGWRRRKRQSVRR
jgi:hypothetical protein